MACFRPSVATSPSAELNPADIKPVERQVEARPIDDAMGSMVRCMYFAKSYIINSKSELQSFNAYSKTFFFFLTLELPRRQICNFLKLKRLVVLG